MSNGIIANSQQWTSGSRVSAMVATTLCCSVIIIINVSVVVMLDVVGGFGGFFVGGSRVKAGSNKFCTLHSIQFVTDR